MLTAQFVAAYLSGQAKRAAALVRRANITSPQEFDVYFDADNETKLLLGVVAPQIEYSVSLGAARVWRARPRVEKAFGPFKLPQFIRDAISDFMDELRGMAWWKNVAAKTNGRVQETITESLDRGDSIPAMARAVQADLTGVIGIRAASIARTETTGAMNAGHSLAMNAVAEENDQIEMLQEWLSILDKRVRQDHKDANGQRIASDGEATFKIGKERARFPGDPKLSARQRVNCRCTIVAAFPEYE